MPQWLMIGEVKVSHRTPGLEYYPEDEHKARGWRLEGQSDLWAQAALLPIKNANIGAQLGMWMTSFGYLVQMRTGKDMVLVMYKHPLYEIDLVQALAEPVVLR